LEELVNTDFKKNIPIMKVSTKRENELLKALTETKKGIESGNYIIESVEDHMKRIIPVDIGTHEEVY